MARIDETVARGPNELKLSPLASSLRGVTRGLVAWSPVIVLLIGWEAFARSGAVTPFMLPAFSAVLERIATDAASGELPVAIGLTLWRALAGFFISAAAGIALGLAMARLRWCYWFFDPIISVGFPIPKIAFLPIIVLWLAVWYVRRETAAGGVGVQQVDTTRVILEKFPVFVLGFILMFALASAGAFTSKMIPYFRDWLT